MIVQILSLYIHSVQMYYSQDKCNMIKNIYLYVRAQRSVGWIFLSRSACVFLLWACHVKAFLDKLEYTDIDYQSSAV